MSNQQVWLTLKPTHIDENFDNFTQYMRNPEGKDNALYRASVKLLDERVKELLNERSATDVFRLPSNEEQLLFLSRLCGVWLLCMPEADYLKRKLVSIMMLNHLLQLCVVSKTPKDDEYIVPLAQMAVGLMHHRLPERPLLDWGQVEKLSMDNYITILHQLVQLELGREEDVAIEYKGRLFSHQGHLLLSALSEHDYKIQGHKQKECLLDDGCGIYLSTSKEKIIKDSEKEDILAVERAVEYLLGEIEQTKVTGSEVKLQHYSDHQEVPTEVVSVSNNEIILRTTDPKYAPIEGKLVFDTNIRLFQTVYPPDLWAQVLNQGDQLQAEVDTSGNCFRITKFLLEYLEQGAQIGDQIDVTTFLIEGKTEYLEFWTVQGDAFFVRRVDNDTISKLQRNHGNAILTVESRGYGLFSGLCFGQLSFDFDEPFTPINRDQVRKPFLEEFIQWLKPSADQDDPTADGHLSAPFLTELCVSLHALQQADTNPLSRYRLLSALRLICAIGERSTETQYFTYFSNYLKTLVLFAMADANEGDVIKQVPVPQGLDSENSIANGEEVLEILSHFAKPYDTAADALQEYINSDDEELSKIASLVQSYNRLQHILEPKTLADIKCRILAHLSIATSNQQRTVELADTSRDSFGYEDDMKEFKASFFNAPNDAPDQQEGIHVFKGVCAMLNAKGGTLYLGVNDHGIPIGLRDDLAILGNRYQRPQPTLDHLMLHISHEGELLFSEPVWRHVSLRPIEQYNIIKFEIEPYPYDIVTLKGQAYIRKNNASAPILDERTRADIRRRRQEALRQCDDKFITLQEAVQQKRQVRLLNYSSSNSASIKNRIVEPFSFDGTDYVICYEPSATGNRNKSFKISRIGQVKILDTLWEHAAEHQPKKFDPFHMSGDTPIPIVLDLRLPAKNILEDLYPRLREYISQTGDSLWRLATEVYSLVPLRGVYLSYAADITIIQAEGLVEAAQEYFNRYVKQ